MIQYPPAAAARANRFACGPAMWYISYKFHVKTNTNRGRIWDQEVIAFARVSKKCLFDRLLFGPSAFAMARVKVWVAMVIYLCAAAPADLKAADAEAAAVSIFISVSDNADMFVVDRRRLRRAIAEPGDTRRTKPGRFSFFV